MLGGYSPNWDSSIRGLTFFRNDQTNAAQTVFAVFIQILISDEVRVFIEELPEVRAKHRLHMITIHAEIAFPPLFFLISNT